jgi:hypothetical protein
MEGRVILMATKASPSETLAWWARAAQARRVAGMLSPRDAQVAEAFAAECEDQAREASVDSFRALRSSNLPYAVGQITKAGADSSPKRILFMEEA